MKVLNLDQFATEKKSITLEGVEYPVKDMTVDHFIESNLAVREFEGLSEDQRKDPVTQLGATVKFILRCIPDLPEEKLRKLDIDRMSLIVQFINNELDEQKLRAKEVQEKIEESEAKEGNAP